MISRNEDDKDDNKKEIRLMLILRNVKDKNM